MKRIFMLFIAFVFLHDISGQVALTFTNNGMVVGDTSRTQEIGFVAPGNAGENIIWDFSGISFTGKNSLYGVAADPSRLLPADNEKPLIFSEDGYDYACLCNQQGVTETGYLNSPKKRSLTFSDPLVRMKFPFSYGEQFSDAFSGISWYNQTSRIDLSGTYKVVADGFGTLILPQQVLKNTLRIRTEKRSLQTNACGSYQISTVKYYWYTAGYRYPVAMICETETRYGVNEPVMTRSGWINLTQQRLGGADEGIDATQPGETGNNVVIVYPNPFTEVAEYHYFLRKQVPVSVELYDVSGRFSIQLERTREHTEGLHGGIIRASMLGLPPGVYYLRFTMAREVVVRKIVRGR